MPYQLNQLTCLFQGLQPVQVFHMQVTTLAHIAVLDFLHIKVSVKEKVALPEIVRLCFLSSQALQNCVANISMMRTRMRFLTRVASAIN